MNHGYTCVHMNTSCLIYVYIYIYIYIYIKITKLAKIATNYLLL